MTNPEYPPDVRIEKTATRWTIGAGWAITILVALLGQTIGATVFVMRWSSGISDDISAVDAKVDTVQQNQDDGKERAEERQAQTQKQIAEVITIGRDRNLALDQRIRPLEAQAAATTATLQAINNSLLQLGADVRDLRKSVEEKRE